MKIRKKSIYSPLDKHCFLQHVEVLSYKNVSSDGVYQSREEIDVFFLYKNAFLVRDKQKINKFYFQ